MRTIISLLLVFGLFMGNAEAAEKGLQQLIDETPANGILELESTTYEGNVTITKPITLIGKKGTVIQGDKTANVIEIESDDVTLDTLAIEGSGMSRSSREEYSGVRVMGNGAVLKNLKITDSFHGIFLNKTNQTRIDRITVIGHGTQALGNQGNGIHIARSSNNHITNSHLEQTRDGIFVEYSNNNYVDDNTMTHTRYGLHYMYSNHNEFKGNHFVNNIGGAAIMHSDHILLEGNQFSFNQGSRSFGLIVQTSRDVHVLNNEFHLNQRGLYLEQSTSNRIEGNDFFQNQVGVELWTSSTAHVFLKNTFDKNKIHALTVGGESNNDWFENGVGNYWNLPMLDLNQNGVGDQALEYRSSLGDLLERNELAYLFLSSPAIAIYEKANELLTHQKVMAYDKYPLLKKRGMPMGVWIFPAIVLGVAIWLVYRRRAVRR
ncbi:nitrous oxide reductase family maturation protein NosD [Sporosarcina sp. 179-K 3D1 HS]|uniref:nitrous oxide reductase family maturation protein NosD n=1 Tax=Sporosarcina sp. 179-K 3D1 HS TaxID=3232169 RepID=UPI0039A1C2EC